MTQAQEGKESARLGTLLGAVQRSTIGDLIAVGASRAAKVRSVRKHHLFISLTHEAAKLEHS
jgi:hypothetical protein